MCHGRLPAGTVRSPRQWYWHRLKARKVFDGPRRDVECLLSRPCAHRIDEFPARNHEWSRSREHLAPYKAPDCLVLLPELPLTSIGKIDKLALQTRAREEAARWTP